MKNIFNIFEQPIWLIVFFTLIGLIPLFVENNIDLFFVCIGTGISIAVVLCAITQNRIQKDNIKLQLFDKRYKVFQVLLDSKTLLERDNWGRYLILKKFDVSTIIFDIEERLYNAAQISCVLFNPDITKKLIEINNQFCNVSEKYKELLQSCPELFTAKDDFSNYIQVLFQYLASNETSLDCEEYLNKLKTLFPKAYILLTEFSKECQEYLAKIEETKILENIGKEVNIRNIDK